MGKLLQAEIEVHQGRAQEAMNLVATALREFEIMGIFEGLNFEFAGRIHRLAGDLAEAEKFLRRGLEAAREFPVQSARLHAELAETLRAKGSQDWALEAQAALLKYRLSECPLRAEEIQKRFKIPEMP